MDPCGVAITSPSQRTRPISSPASAYARSATRRPGLPMHADVVERAPGAVGAADGDRRQLDRVELARERAGEVLLEAVGVDRGEEADLAVVDGEDRARRCRRSGAARSGSCRRRRGRRRGRRRSPSSGTISTNGPTSIPCLSASSGVKHSVTRRRAGDLHQLSHGLRGVRRAPVRDDGGALTTPRPPRRRPGRAPSASHRNVSRLPDGPASADGALPITAAPSAAGGRGDVLHDLAPQRRVARRRRPCRSGRARPRTAA